jgi:uncharacterized protein (DUF952 family)
MPDRLYHIAETRHWAAACRTGRYERSTRGRSLGEVGFVHLATADQWPGVLERHYADHEGELLLLAIDPVRLGAPVRWAAPHSASTELFPHLHGPLEVAAVVAVEPVRWS